VSDELCMCGHRKSLHKAIVCDWWNCKCRQFEPLAADKPKPERKPSQEFPSAGDIISADVAAHDIISADAAVEDIIGADAAAQDVIRANAAQEIEQLRSKLGAAQEEIGKLKQLQDGDYMLATRLGAENKQLREALAEIKRLVEAMLTRP
jgi:hypothetical protein